MVVGHLSSVASPMNHESFPWCEGVKLWKCSVSLLGERWAGKACG